MPAFIADGYTRTTIIAASKQHDWEEITLTYRPVLVVERAEANRKLTMAGEDAVKVERVAAEVVKSHVVSWSIRGENGSAWPVTIDNILRLKPALFDRLYRIVLGLDAGDGEAREAETEQEKN